MAVIRDPNNPKFIEEERARRQREESLARRAGLGLRRFVEGGQVGGKELAGNTAVRNFVGDFVEGARGAPAGSSRAQNQNSGYKLPRDVQVNLKKAPAADESLIGARGLTRIQKTVDANGNSVYTQVPVASGPRRGDDRIYDATGFRADQDPNAEIAPRRGLSREGTVRQFYADMNAQPTLDPTSREGIRLLRKRGEEGLAIVANQNAQGAQRLRLDSLMRMDPADRATMETAAAKEAGLDRRAQLDLQGKLAIAEGSQAIARANSDLSRVRLGLEQDRYFNERLSNPETRGLGINEVLRTVPPSQLESFLASNDPRALTVLDAIQQQARAVTGDEGYNLATARRNSGFIDALLGGGKMFDLEDDGTFLSSTDIDASELGLTPEQVDAARKALLRRANGSR